MTQSSETPVVSPAAEALQQFRMDGAFYCRAELTAPFGIDLPPMEETLLFHIVTSGRAWIDVEGEEICLGPGELALIPQGRGHCIRSEPEAGTEPLFDLPLDRKSERYEELRWGGGGRMTHMVCGAVRFDHPAAESLVDLLPRLVVIDAWSETESQWLQATIKLIGDEARELRPGSETIMTRLCDVLVVQALRTWMATAPAARQGWLGALHDEQLGPALSAVHADPEHDWTLEELARECAMSRSAFSAKFTEIVGEPPMRYVTRWRMQMAHTLLRESKLNLDQVAERYGYSSKAAFSRAFKRFMGVSPGRSRNRAG